MNDGTGNTITVRRYSGNDADAWNGFVRTSRNGTFLHNRGYMDYHADRFADHSLMFYADEELIAIMPAHVKENSLCSHNGLTYGGLLLSDRTTTETLLAIFAALKEYLLNNGIIEVEDAETGQREWLDTSSRKVRRSQIADEARAEYLRKLART